MDTHDPHLAMILFDLGGVVCRFDPLPRSTALADACGVPPEVVEAELFTSGFDRDCDRGLHSAQSVLDRLRGLGFAGSLDDLRGIWTLAFRPDPAVLDLVARCRTRHRTGLLTDNGPLLLEAMPQRLPEVVAAVDDLLFSCTLGAVKPDQAIFEAALRRTGADGHQVLFIDDSARNVTAARSAGLSATLFTDPDALAGTLRAAGALD